MPEPMDWIEKVIAQAKLRGGLMALHARLEQEVRNLEWALEEGLFVETRHASGLQSTDLAASVPASEGESLPSGDPAVIDFGGLVSDTEPAVQPEGRRKRVVSAETKQKMRESAARRAAKEAPKKTRSAASRASAGVSRLTRSREIQPEALRDFLES